MKTFDWICMAVVAYLIACVPLAWNAHQQAKEDRATLYRVEAHAAPVSP